MCTNQSLQGIFSIVKRVMLLIQIIVPILLIVFASISFMKLVKNPEERNGTKRIINQFIAAVIVFFIPILVNVVMNLAGDNNEISSCWMSASDKNIINTTYNSSGEKERKKIIYDAVEYEKGESGHWEIDNNKYIYHYLDGTAKKWTESEYVAWNKLIEQNVKAMDPTAYTITYKKGKKTINYLGISHTYRCSDDTANQKAIANGVSPYAITVDLDNNRQSIFENHNEVWEPIKNLKVNIGKTWKEYGKPNSNPKIYAKDSLTPTGLFYTDGCNLKTWGEGQPYWVAFGVYPRDRDFNEDYFHTTLDKVSVGRDWTLGCISLKIEDAKWIYYNCGRGTPVLIW